MKIDSNFNFEVSVSEDAYTDKVISGAMIGSSKVEENRNIRKKYGFQSNKGIGYKRITTNSKQLLDCMINGKVMCNLFNPKHYRKDGTFGSSEKIDMNFEGSFIVSVDIDKTHFSTAEEYISKLQTKPTFWYTSYSNQQAGKGARFRMMYVFDRMIYNPYYFRYVAWTLNKTIENEVGEEIDDYCNIRCSQYFNGTNISNPDVIVSYGLTDIVYSLDDFNINTNGFLNFLNNYAYYKTKTKSRTKSIQYLISNLISKYHIQSNEERSSNVSTTYYDDWENLNTSISEPVEVKFNPILIDDMYNMDFDTFMKYNRHQYKYIYRKDNGEWVNDSFQYVDDDYFALYWNTTTITDGNQRRKKLYNRMCLRRILFPEVDADTLLFCAYVDRERFIDNSDEVVSIECLKKNVMWAMDKDIEDLKDEFSDSIAYLKKNTPKRGKIYKNKQSIQKGNYTEISLYYNSTLSVNENLTILEQNGVKVSKTTLYRYIKDNNIQTKPTDEEIIQLLDKNLSIRKNKQLLEDNYNISISIGKLSKLFNTSTSTTYYSNWEKMNTTEDDADLPWNDDDTDVKKNQQSIEEIENIFNGTNTIYYNPYEVYAEEQRMDDFKQRLELGMAQWIKQCMESLEYE